MLLLKRGDLKMRMARANFCFNFLGCAGFDIVEAEEYAGTDADLIVLCSSDPEYLAFAQEVCAAGQRAGAGGGQSQGPDRGTEGRRRAGLHPRPERRRPDAHRVAEPTGDEE